MSFERHPIHFKDSELQKTEEVQNAVEKKERLSGESIPNDPTPRIDTYINRLENIFLNPDEEVRERNIDMFRNKIHDNLLIKRESFPESYFDLQKRIARERGQAVEEIPEETKEQMKSVAIEDQKASLDAWIDYLSSNDAMYPAWFKYYVWTQVTKLSQFDKERGEYKTRTSTTVAPFPDIYREPLAQIADLYEKYPTLKKEIEPKVQTLRAKRNALRKQLKGLETETERTAIQDEMDVIEREIAHIEAPLNDFNKKFPSLYAELTNKSLAASMEGKEETRGEWIKYNHGDMDDAEKLYSSLEHKGTGWCTAGKSTAEAQVESGDFYVYYTYDKNGTPTQPRIAIRMQGDDIGEVRGVLPHQNLEPIMQDVLNEKLKDFGSKADAYRKKFEDMKLLTKIDEKTKNGEQLNKSDLEFLYETNGTIQGFGYDMDPRIYEIRGQRDRIKDMITIFDCTEKEVAVNIENINEHTKSYLGPWNPTVYNKIKNFPQITHLYESFPDKKIFTYELETDPQIDSPKKAEEELKARGIYITDWGNYILQKTEFSLEEKTYNLVQFTVEQLGFPRGATTDEIYAKAQELGLDLCPAEVGPQLRLKYEGKDWKLIAMKQISDRHGNPFVFYLFSGGAGLSLRASRAELSNEWSGSCQFVFMSRN